MSTRYLEYRGPLAADYLRKSVRMRGGRTPWDEPRYRLIWAPERYEQSAGIWHDWDENLGINDRNYVDRQGNDLNKPIRVVEEIRWVPKYPVELQKWILEKWLPPENYGTQENWYSYKTPSGLACLGRYPHEGDYEDTGYAFPNEALTEAIVLNAIGRIEHYVDSLPSTLEGRMIRANYNGIQNDIRKEAELEKKHKDIVADAGFAFHGKTFSSGAGEKHKSDIEATADKLGISSLSYK